VKTTIVRGSPGCSAAPPPQTSAPVLLGCSYSLGCAAIADPVAHHRGHCLRRRARSSHFGAPPLQLPEKLGSLWNEARDNPRGRTHDGLARYAFPDGQPCIPIHLVTSSRELVAAGVPFRVSRNPAPPTPAATTPPLSWPPNSASAPVLPPARQRSPSETAPPTTSQEAQCQNRTM
jgi:hypothetical protein